MSQRGQWLRSRTLILIASGNGEGEGGRGEEFMEIVWFCYFLPLHSRVPHDDSGQITSQWRSVSQSECQGEEEGVKEEEKEEEDDDEVK